MTEVALFANPYSGHGPNRRRVDALVQALRARSIEPHLVWSPDERRALLASPGLADRFAALITAGGDGSIRDTLNDLADADALDAVPFTTFPVGNENLFARQFGIGRDPDALADAIAAGREARIDLGDANGCVFSLMCSIGFDADVVHRMDRWRRGDHDGATESPIKLKRVRKLSYVSRTLAAFHAFDTPPLRVRVAGDTHEGYHVFVFNMPQYGGGLPFAPHADPADGRLNYIVFERPGRLGLLRYLRNVALGSAHLKLKDVRHGTADELTVTTTATDDQGDPLPAAPPAFAQSDGDPAGTTPTTIRVRPGALRIITTHSV